MHPFGGSARPVAVGVAAIVLIAFAAVRSALFHFECPSCGERFRVPFLKYLFSMHTGFARRVKCPKCGKVDYLTPKTGKI